MVTLRTALDEFRRAMIADGLKSKTVYDYLYLLDRSPANPRGWLGARGIGALGDVSTPILREYLTELRTVTSGKTGERLSDKTIDDYVRVMHRFFGWAAAEYEIPNPMKRIAFPKVKEPKPKAIAVADVIKLIAACDDSPIGRRNAAIIYTLLDTGLRAGGLVSITPADLDMNGRRLVVTEKGGKTRVVFFTDMTALMIARWMINRPTAAKTIFCADDGAPLSTSGLRQLLKRLGRRAGVARCNPHSFRHAFALGYLRRGGSLAELSKLMGHERFSTTALHYVNFEQTTLRDAHERFSPIGELNHDDDQG